MTTDQRGVEKKSAKEHATSHGRSETTTESVANTTRKSGIAGSVDTGDEQETEIAEEAMEGRESTVSLDWPDVPADEPGATMHKLGQENTGERECACTYSWSPVISMTT